MKKMSISSKNAILLGLLSLFIIASGVFFFMSQQNTVIPLDNVQENPSFDIRKQISGTTISIAYPSVGLYGHGAEVFEENTDRVSGIHIQPTDESAIGMEFVTVDVRRFKDKTYSDLEVAIEQVPKGVYEEEYMKINGRFMTINDRRIFVYEASEDVMSNAAWMLDNDGALVIASIAYKGGAPDPEAAATRNADLLLQIVKGLQF